MNDFVQESGTADSAQPQVSGYDFDRWKLHSLRASFAALRSRIRLKAASEPRGLAT